MDEATAELLQILITCLKSAKGFTWGFVPECSEKLKYNWIKPKLWDQD